MTSTEPEAAFAPGRRTLAVGGLDPSVGAGVLLDAIVMAAAGYAPAVAITTLTAQNSATFLDAWTVAPEVLRAQLEAVAADGRLAGVKIGAVGSVEVAQALAEWLARSDVGPVVLDPVLASSSGGALVDDVAGAVATLAPHVDVITPNCEEAGCLSGIEIGDERSASEAARELAQRLGCAVVVTGLRESGRIGAVDVLATGSEVAPVPHSLVEVVGDVRGTGCLLASALLCELADGLCLADGLRRAHSRVNWLVRQARPLGPGRLQVDLRHLIRGSDQP